MLLCHKIFSVTKPIIFRLCKLLRRSRQVSVGEAPGSDENLTADGDRLSQTPESPVDEDSELRPTGAVQWGLPPLPPNCSRLDPRDIEIFGNIPYRAGAFTDVWEGSLAGGRVVIKSYRLYSATDPTQARMRLYKEALACSMLSHQNIVPFRAAYTSPKHPLALVYDFMGHRSLKEYLRENRGIKRLRLLADIAQGLFHMHDLGVIHGNLEINNILVDLGGAARVAGLGSAFAPSENHITWSEMDAELLFYGTAPELVRPNPPGSRIHTTKESDIYAFALLAWELFAERVPFSNNLFAAIYLLADGTRPPHPHHPELSNQVWNMIEKCWHHNPHCRMTIENVVSVLGTEIY